MPLLTIFLRRGRRPLRDSSEEVVARPECRTTKASNPDRPALGSRNYRGVIPLVAHVVDALRDRDREGRIPAGQ